MGLGKILTSSVRTGKETMNAALHEAAEFQRAGGILDANKTIKEVAKRTYNGFSQTLSQGLTNRMANMEQLRGKELFKTNPGINGSSGNLPATLGTDFNKPGAARSYSKWQMAKSFFYDGDTGAVSKARIAGAAAGVGAGAYALTPSSNNKRR